MAAQSTCGDVGGCNGANACTLYPNNDVCVAATCMSATVVLKAELCDGIGDCKAQMSTTIPCAPYLCAAGACTSTCNTDSNCAPGNYCNVHTCTPKLTDGTACSASGSPTQCVNGNCVDGVCCHTACNTACMACSAALNGGTNGTCGPALNGPDPRMMCAKTGMASCGTDGNCLSGACEVWPSTTVCTPASCSMAMDQQTTAATCSGTAPGACNPGTTTSCNGLICGTGACLTSCAGSDTNCIPGDYCTAGNTCAPKVAPGGACTTGDQCSGAGICLGNVCCTAACTGSGTCGAGACQAGTGACVYPAALTLCPSGGTCAVGDVLEGLQVCDGAGTCQTIAITDCPTGTCAPGGCSSCMADPNCTAYGYCNSSSMCTPKGQPGAACTAGTQCLNGTCKGGTTCN
jgi:hypothetical protein